MDVGDWLRGLGLGQYEAMFRESEIDGEIVALHASPRGSTPSEGQACEIPGPIRLGQVLADRCAVRMTQMTHTSRSVRHLVIAG